MGRPPYVSFGIRNEQPGRKISSSDLIESLVDEIASGRIPPGCRLPPVRAIERQFGLSKNTAQAAYDEMVARGLLESREREGVFVAPRPEQPARFIDAPRPPALQLRPPPLSHTTRPDREIISLSTVFIDPALLPTERFADCLRSVLKTPGISPFYDFQGYLPLRESIAARLRARGMDVTASQVVITAGSQQAIDLVARSMSVKRVAMENPVYSHAKLLFETSGFEVTGLRLDPFRGPDLEAWSESFRIARPSLFYAITSFQNPTGYSYTTHELTEILRLARANDFALLEDDWGSDMLSGTEYRPSLRLLGGPNVVYVNSFTKKLLPSLRIGFVVASDELIPSLVAAKRIATLGNAWILEAALSEFLDRGYYDTHLAALQQELDLRYEHCLTSLRELMPSDVRWTTPGGGPTLWLDVPHRVELSALENRLAARSVQIESTANAFFGERHLHGFRISYAYSSTERLRRGLEILSEEIGQESSK